VSFTNRSGPGNNILEGPVTEFVDPVARLLDELTKQTGRASTSTAVNDVTLEAFNLVCAVLDSDDRHTDEEIWALLTTFGPKFPTQLAYATPNDVRNAGLLRGKKTWLDRPTTLFDLLIAADRKNQTNVSWTYYQKAIALSHYAVALDMSPTETELKAVDRYRSMLVDTLERNGISRESQSPAYPSAPSTPTPQPGVATATTPATALPAPEPLPPPEAIEDLLAELDALVGLKGVKQEVRLVTNLLQVHQLRRERSLPTPDSSLHLIFAGNPGTGKTTVARLLARIYRSLGVVEKGHLVETDRAGLVAGFVGQTALKVTEVFDRADGGVLLIDEAYALARGGEKDFGQEAVDTLVKLIEDRRDRLVVVAAGYPAEMATFVDSNPGLRSRFPKTIVFDDYSDGELVKIFEGLCAKNKYEPTPAALKAAQKFFASHERTKGFGNGRVARNLFEQAMAAQASRLMAPVTKPAKLTKAAKPVKPEIPPVTDSAPSNKPEAPPTPSAVDEKRQPTDAELLAIEAVDIAKPLATPNAPSTSNAGDLK
jgi:ATPase family associated with various cellular activities (AAA)/AAA lid domain